MAADERPALALESFIAPRPAAEEWAALAQLWLAVHQDRVGWPEDLAAVIDWYTPHLERLHDHAPARRLDLVQLAQIAAAYTSRERFLTEATLDPPEATSDRAGDPSLDEDYLILSTIHSAKGQEWQAVSVLNVVDGCIPGDLGTGSSAQVEEERRLLYVAMTRARQHLSLIVPQRFYVTQQGRHGDRHVYGGRSRFLPDEILPCFEPLRPRPDGALPTPPPATVLDLRDRMRGLWE
jgi:DNA helicase-2/ATP-dependent DNA helicase PcrA